MKYFVCINQKGTKKILLKTIRSYRMYEIITKNLAAKLKINEKYVTNVLNLLEEGNTIAFIARYRKELTKFFRMKLL